MLISQLKYCLAVMELKSFSKAADKCCVTQPTLSQQIRQLEAYLGVVIFDRSTKPVKVTKEGSMILAKAYTIVSTCTEIEHFALTVKAANISAKIIEAKRIAFNSSILLFLQVF